MEVIVWITDIKHEMYLTLSVRKASDLTSHAQINLRRASENVISGLFPSNMIHRKAVSGFLQRNE